MPTRRLAAILAADVVGYSRLVSADETDALARLSTLRSDVIEPGIAKHSGRLFKVMGDGFLVEFASAVQAVTCAMAIQAETEQEAAMLDEPRKMRLRIGIHVGDVLVEGDDLMGDGVNTAARLESIAAPGGISISRAVHDQVRDRMAVEFDDKGEIALKNIARPVQVFALGGAKDAAAKSLPGPTPALTLPDKPSIAVLPFKNISGDPEQEYFADGMVEDIIIALSRYSSLFVIARNSFAHQRAMWHLGKASAEDNALAEKFFQRAIDLDPMFVGGYIGLSRRAQPGERDTSEGRGTGEACCRARCRQRRRSLPPCACAARGRRSSGCGRPGRAGIGDMSESSRRARSARRSSGLLRPTRRRACGAQDMHSARPARPVAGEPFEPGRVGALFLPRLRGQRRSGRASDPVVPRFPLALPLARRRPRRTWPDRGAKAALEKAVAISPASFDFQAVNARPGFVRKSTPTCSMASEKPDGRAENSGSAEPLPRPCQSAK
jgi:class 3 adenylate cyclase